MTGRETERSELPVAIVRGGTSRGVLLRLGDVPDPGPERDRFLVRLMGSDDPGQVDGLGGNTSVTSKVMLVSHHGASPSGVEYLFAQVDPRHPVVDYGGNCGNMTAAVALYVVTEGIVPAVVPTTEVVLHNLNTGTQVRARVPTGPDGPESTGTHHIAGISTSGPEIVTDYLEPAGRSGHLPTGSAQDVLDVPELGEVTVSVVDVASPLVFVRARDVGLVGTEPPDAIDGDDALLRRLEALRGEAAARLGLVARAMDAARLSPGIPKLTIVSAPVTHRTSDGEVVNAEDVDLVVRMLSVQRAHHAIAVTGALCTAAAVALPGTIPNDIAPPGTAGVVRIGHPKGVTTSRAEVETGPDGSVVRTAGVSRTARYVMRGWIDPR